MGKLWALCGHFVGAFVGAFGLWAVLDRMDDAAGLSCKDVELVSSVKRKRSGSEDSIHSQRKPPHISRSTKLRRGMQGSNLYTQVIRSLNTRMARVYTSESDARLASLAAQVLLDPLNYRLRPELEYVYYLRVVRANVYKGVDDLEGILKGEYDEDKCDKLVPVTFESIVANYVRKYSAVFSSDCALETLVRIFSYSFFCNEIVSAVDDVVSTDVVRRDIRRSNDKLIISLRLTSNGQDDLDMPCESYMSACNYFKRDRCEKMFDELERTLEGRSD